MSISFDNGWEAKILGNGGWRGLQSENSSRFQRVTDEKRDGQYAVRVEVRNGDNVYGTLGERSEVLRMLDGNGREIQEGANSGIKVFAFSVKLAENWVAPTAYGIMWQLHNETDAGSAPLIAISATDRFVLRVNGGDITRGDNYAMHDLADGSLKKGQWVDFVLRINFAVSSAGSVEIWRRDQDEADFQRVLFINTPTLQSYDGRILNQYHKFGLYRAQYDSTASHVLYLDDFIRGDTVEEVIARMKDGAGANYTRGNGGNDYLPADPGGSTIDAGAGDDTVEGGDGVDVVSGGAGRDSIHGDAGDDILSGGDGIDTVDGGLGNDRIDGGAGDDDLLGGGGNDIIEGGAGDDDATGGDGNDTIRGDAGNDYLSGDSGNDDLSGDPGNDTVYGSSGNDVLRGGDGRDSLNGGSGNDTVDGDAGDDSMRGESGNDVLDGGDDNDRIYGGNGRDTLDGGGGADFLSGDGDWDLLRGGDGTDRLEGGSGNDVLWGGGGDDTMTGGDGADTIGFSDAFGRDTVLNFGNGNNKLLISGYGDDLNSFNEIQRYMRTVGSNTVIDLTGQGGGIIEVVGRRGLDSDDFTFIA